MMGVDTGVAASVGGGAARVSLKSEASKRESGEMNGLPSYAEPSGPGGEICENSE